jgi:hypothetical protein
MHQLRLRRGERETARVQLELLDDRRENLTRRLHWRGAPPDKNLAKIQSSREEKLMALAQEKMHGMTPQRSGLGRPEVGVCAEAA